jgi:hypothetical protein
VEDSDGEGGDDFDDGEDSGDDYGYNQVFSDSDSMPLYDYSDDGSIDSFD